MITQCHREDGVRSRARGDALAGRNAAPFGAFVVFFEKFASSADEMTRRPQLDYFAVTRGCKNSGMTKKLTAFATRSSPLAPVPAADADDHRQPIGSVREPSCFGLFGEWGCGSSRVDCEVGHAKEATRLFPKSEIDETQAVGCIIELQPPLFESRSSLDQRTAIRDINPIISAGENVLDS